MRAVLALVVCIALGAAASEPATGQPAADGRAAASTLTGTAAAPAGRPWRPDVAAARDYAERRAGTVSFAVRTGRGFHRHDAYRADSAASVVKAMLLVAYLRDPAVRGRPLRRDERALLGAMVRRSVNRAATRVRDMVGDAALQRLAERVGMARFATAPSWGATQVTAAGLSKLMLRVDRHVPVRHRAYAMRLLRTVVARQRWGIADVAHAGWTLHFKSGWGDYGERDHQVALLRRGRRRIAVAILVTASPSHAYGKETLRGVAARLLRGLGPDSLPR